jgi:transcriptional regulator with XRE-family HTH domain
MQGIRLRKAREDANLTQEELAEKIGMGVLQINRYENEKNDPTADVLGRIATALNVSADYLIGLTDDPNPSILANGLSPKERAIVVELRRGNAMKAVKAIVDDE